MTKFSIAQGSKTKSATVKRNSDHIDVIFENKTFSFEQIKAAGASVFILNGQVFDITILKKNDASIDVLINGVFYTLPVQDERKQASTSSSSTPGSEKEIKAIMPGRVTKVLVKEGEPVEPGKPLLVLEAMKMENEIKALTAGTIEKIFVKTGDTIETGAMLVKIS